MPSSPGTGRPRGRFDFGFFFWVVAPVTLIALLNAAVRPALADALGGQRRASYVNYRSQDGWWTFDAATRSDHPILTAFLSASDGLVGVSVIAGWVVLFALVWLIRRLRNAARTTKSPATRA